MTKIALCQINPWVGNLHYNFSKIQTFFNDACAKNVDGIVFPECVITGYPTEDLVLKPAFMGSVESIVHDIASMTSDFDGFLLLGSPWYVSMDDGYHLMNCALWIERGIIKHVIPKQALPNDGVFDEKRIFKHGLPCSTVQFKHHQFGVMICEDMWSNEVKIPANTDCLIVLNGSPYDDTKHAKRIALCKQRVDEGNCDLIYLNLVGGQDSLVFDGHSFVMDQKGTVVGEMKCFQEDLQVAIINDDHSVQCDWEEQNYSDNERLYHALVLGLRDYIHKNGFKGILLGMSGGIDSAISAAIAVDAIGSDRVHCVMMPSPYTSQESLDDAADASNRMGIKHDEISIEPAMRAYDEMLSVQFKDKKPDITEENIQSRARGVLLMALSNQSGWMVLSTGNKSEVATGYATLYGDMCGGYNALKDVYKTKVFELCRFRNEFHHASWLGPKGEIIPERIITKPPSAELRPDQKDEDSLPPYDILDQILKGFIEDDLFISDLINMGFQKDHVERVISLLDRAEYKRRQAAPGPKVTSKALSHERRYPITNGFKSAIILTDEAKIKFKQSMQNFSTDSFDVHMEPLKKNKNVGCK
jgi:NAD+ synthase